MVQAANFGNGQTQLWALTNKWRSDITRYGYLCEQLGAASPGSQASQQLRAETCRLAVDLYTRAAQLEMDAQCSGDGLAKAAGPTATL